MREFDNRQSWLDNEGKPLIGRISFYKKDTSEYETITDVDGTSLSNPVFTNTLGQTVVQVFLQDNKDYTINFEKYIGNGDYTQDEEITNWEFQYSCDNLYDVYGIEVNCDGVQAVNTINDLQNFDPALVANERNYIQVLGYNELGDCEPVYYIWNANSVASTNGGSVIASNISDTGRWELVNTFIEFFDIRHFGVFGASTRQLAEVQMGAQIILAQEYANSIGKKLYFPAIENDATWYNLQTVQAINNGHFDSNVYLFDNTNQRHYITTTEDSDFRIYGDANFVLIADTVKTSLGQDGTNVRYAPNSVLLIDSIVATSNKDIANVTVKATTLIEGWTFTSCTFDLIEKFYSNCNFHNCYLIEQYFYGNYVTNTFTVDDDCVLDIQLYKNMDLYIQLREQQSSRYLNLNNNTLTRMPNWTDAIYLTDAILVANVSFIANIIYITNCNGAFTHIRQGQLGISTLSFTDTICTAVLPTNIDYLTLVNSTISSTNLSLFTVRQYLNIQKNSTLSSTVNVMVTNTCEVDDSVINAFIVCDSGFVMNKSTLQKRLQVKSALTITNSVVNAVINQISNTNSLRCVIMYNIFGEEGEHFIASTVPDTIVHGKWIGNNNNGSLFIEIDRTNLHKNDTLHDYEYRDNSGDYNCNSQKVEDVVHFDNNLGLSKFLQYRDQIVEGTISIPGVGDVPVSLPEEYGILEFRGKNTTGNAGTTDTNVYLTAFNMFTIGTTGIKPILLHGNIINQFDIDESNNKKNRVLIQPNIVQLDQFSWANNGAYPWDGEHAGEHEYEGFPAGIVKDSNENNFMWYVCDAPRLFTVDRNFAYTTITTDIGVIWYFER